MLSNEFDLPHHGAITQSDTVEGASDLRSHPGPCRND